jgi:outer membrane protein assembly factor BamE (lipoprotein component of BamABCDE complex)
MKSNFSISHINRALLIAAALIALMKTSSGCMSAAEHQQSLHSTQEQNFTLGLVQKRITKGMSQAEVAESLGSPNMVTKDQTGDETWVYDKIASEASYSTDRGGVAGLGGGGGTPGNALILGGLVGNYDRAAGASASTNRTLTVVIRFDKQARVKDFSYHSSKF